MGDIVDNFGDDNAMAEVLPIGPQAEKTPLEFLREQNEEKEQAMAREGTSLNPFIRVQIQIDSLLDTLMPAGSITREWYEAIVQQRLATVLDTAAEQMRMAKLTQGVGPLVTA